MLSAVFVSSCASAPELRREPVFKLVADDVGAKGDSCGGMLEVSRGKRPDGSRVVSVLAVSADRAVSLEALEQLLQVAARRRCASGFVVLRATADDGATGYLEATAESWTRAPVVAGDADPVAAP